MKKIFVILLLACIGLLGNSSFARAEVLLKIEGIDGESAVKGYENWIEVLSWTWQMSSPNTSFSGTRVERAIVRPLIVTKYIDKASPHLSMDLLTGEMKPQAILVGRRQGIEPFEYLRITMEPVYIVNVSPGGSAADERFTESVALAFGKVCYRYTPQKADGTADAAIERCFNLEQNVEQ